jgi:hypothetical protein
MPWEGSEGILVGAHLGIRFRVEEPLLEDREANLLCPDKSYFEREVLYFYPSTRSILYGCAVALMLSTPMT